MNNPIPGAKKRQWWNETWNPITGCTRVSAGCEHCYAHGMYERFPEVIHGRNEMRHGPVQFSNLVFHADRQLTPIMLAHSRRVFVGSMTDFLHEQIEPEWLARIWDTMRACQRHQYYLLTKRPQNASKKMAGLPALPNVHIGVTVEAQEYVQRIDDLLRIPGGDFVSVEPMLGPVVIPDFAAVKWLICGAETGPGARPMNLDWARSLKRQCADADIPFWQKSAGRNIEVPADLDVMELPQ